MATVKAYHEVDNNRVRRVTWEALTTTNDLGSLESLAHLSEMTVNVRGTFGAGGAVVLEDDDGNVLRDAQGGNLSFTTKGTKVVLEKPKNLRPHITGGDGTTDLDVEITGKPDMG